MLRRTFQHIPGIGPWREKDLWARGIRSWEEFPSDTGCISPKTDALARMRIAEAQGALERRDLPLLGRLIPAREHWRLYPEFRAQAVFFDIETEGHQGEQRPTVVSLFHAEGLELFIQGRNMEGLPAALGKRPLWITFNGSCFDVPVLRSHFPDLPAPAVHVDLRFFFRRQGMAGGLKALEESFGVGRPAHLRGVNGWDAVLLWRAYAEEGDTTALRRLVEYNLYDTFQLRSLMELGFVQAASRLGFEESSLGRFERTELLGAVTQILKNVSPEEPHRDLLNRLRAKDGAAQTPLPEPQIR